MRTPPEIQAEIVALKALNPVGKHSDSTRRRIDLAIKELVSGIDDTAEEFVEMSPGDQEWIIAIRSWKEKYSEERPSLGLGLLVAQSKKK